MTLGGPHEALLRYRVDVPVGRAGKWRVSRFSLSPSESLFTLLRAGVNNRPREYVPVGRYTRLTCGSTLFMTDTPGEVMDSTPFIQAADHGTVLIHGLGLGVVLTPILERRGVRRVTVIENAREVIRLIAPHYQKRWGNRLDIIEGDAFTWRPTRATRWDFVWHDIWSVIDDVAVADFARLDRRFRKRAGWQGFWMPTDLAKRVGADRLYEYWTGRSSHEDRDPDKPGANRPTHHALRSRHPTRPANGERCSDRVNWSTCSSGA